MIRSAYVEITNKCNLNCMHCYNASGSSKSRIELPADVLEKIFVSLHMNSGLSAFDISGGEPLLHSQWGQVLDVMEKLRDFSFFVVTNGTVRDDRFYNLLETDSRFMVQFSIDGVDEETHAKTRGKGNFKKTIENLSSLKPKVRPVIKMVVSRYNHDQIEDYFKLAMEYNCKPSFAFAEKMGHADENWQDIGLDPYEKLSVTEQIDVMKNKYGIDTITPYALFHCPLVKESEPLNICIKSDGRIQPCQNLYDSRFTIGSAYDLNYSSMKNNVDNLRDILQERQKADFGCAKCMNRDICTKGCVASAFNHTGSVFSDDGDCRFRKLQTSKLIQKSVINVGKGMTDV